MGDFTPNDGLGPRFLPQASEINMGKYLAETFFLGDAPFLPVTAFPWGLLKPIPLCPKSFRGLCPPWVSPLGSPPTFWVPPMCLCAPLDASHVPPCPFAAPLRSLWVSPVSLVGVPQSSQGAPFASLLPPRKRGPGVPHHSSPSPSPPLLAPPETPLFVPGCPRWKPTKQPWC